MGEDEISWKQMRSPETSQEYLAKMLHMDTIHQHSPHFQFFFGAAKKIILLRSKNLRDHLMIFLADDNKLSSIMKK